MGDKTHLNPRLTSAERPDRITRRGRLRNLLIGSLIATALVAAVAYTWSRGTADGGKAITLVKEQTAQTLARLSPQAKLDVRWTAAPMGTTSGEDMQMVEATLVSSDPRTIRKAVYMVDVDTGEVLAQDAVAASLLGTGGQVDNSHR